ARNDFPPKDLREFVAYVKANADKLNMAHAGVGSTTFTYGLLLNSLLGVKPTMVPFNGAASAMNALIAGHADYMCLGSAEAGPQIQAGTIKAYATGGNLSVTRPCHTSRLPRRLGCQTSNHRHGLLCLRRRGHRSRYSTV